MTAPDTARAIALIDAELETAGVPEHAREALSPSILGALTGRFMFIPHPTAAEDAAARADLAALDIPGFHDFIPPTKGGDSVEGLRNRLARWLLWRDQHLAVAL